MNTTRQTIKFGIGATVRDTFGHVGKVVDTTERPIANRYEFARGGRRSFAYGHLVRFSAADNDSAHAATLAVATAESDEIWISGYDLEALS